MLFAMCFGFFLIVQSTNFRPSLADEFFLQRATLFTISSFNSRSKLAELLVSSLHATFACTQQAASLTKILR